MIRSPIILAIAIANAAIGGDYKLSVDCNQLDAFPLQKTQFGVSYTGSTTADMENVYELLQARNTRNNDKRLRGTWTGWDASGSPVYERNERVSTLLENAGRYGAIGGANLQGPVEHLGIDDYRTSSQLENQWDWTAYSRHSVLYHKHLRSLIQSANHSDLPFVFGIGHEVNNDSNLDTMGLGDGCVDGIAFMGNMDAFYDLVKVKGEKGQGDVIQATNYFTWYKQTMDGLYQEYDDRRQYLITAGQPHTSPFAMKFFLKTFKELVDGSSAKYVPDYVGSHARWNIPGNERFYKFIVEPSRSLFTDHNWMAVPLQCNEFGIYDFDEKYIGSLLGAVRLLTNFERMLMSPDVGYVNFIYNNRIASEDGMDLHPAFHAFRFYQSMPQSRLKVSGDLTKDMHVLSSFSSASNVSAMIWRDGDGEGTDTVDFEVKNIPDKWDNVRASVYLISHDNSETPVFTKRWKKDFGFAGYMKDGYPRTISRDKHTGKIFLEDLVLPRAAIAMIRLDRLDAKGTDVKDANLNRKGPIGAQFLKAWQWTARSGKQGTDPSWGFFDTRNWTLFAGVADTSGKGGSAIASYLDGSKVKRGMAGVEFKSGSAKLELEPVIETGNLHPDELNNQSVAAIRIDFFNGKTREFEAAVILGSNLCPEMEAYTEDFVSWGYGQADVSILPQRILSGILFENENLVIDLDDYYMQLTGKPNPQEFVAGGRRIIVSSWVENVAGGMVVRIGTN